MDMGSSNCSALPSLLRAVETLLQSDEFCDSIPGSSTRGRTVQIVSLVERQVGYLFNATSMLPLLQDGQLYLSDIKAACLLHGIATLETCDQDLESLVLDLLRHLLHGECYCTESVGCFVVKSSHDDGRQHLITLFTSILTDLFEAAFLRKCVQALTDSTARLLTELDTRRFLEGYMNGIIACREPFLMLQSLEGLPLVSLTAFCLSHGLATTDDVGHGLTRHQLINTIVSHICTEGCNFSSDKSTPAFCQPDRHVADDNLRLSVLQYSLKHKMKLRPLRRVLGQLDIPHKPSHTLRDVRRIIKDDIRRLNKAKRNEQRKEAFKRARHLARTEQSAFKTSVCDSWPQPVSEGARDQALRDFAFATGSEHLQELDCAVCGCSKFIGDIHSELLSLDAFDISLLKCHFPPKAPQPFKDDHPLAGCMLNSKGVLSDADGTVRLRMCTSCHKSLVIKSVLPADAIANDLFLGDIPPALQDLTVVEEAMIARRRAKMWLVHLRSDMDNQNAPNTTGNCPPITRGGATEQRGMRGHVLVFPSEPKSLPRLLPPSLEEIAAPICVVFVGSTPPTKQWLREKARPLLVRKEKILAALVWLKQNNPLYADVEIDHEVMSNWDSTEIVPAEIHLQSPTTAGDALTSRYDTEAAVHCGCSGPCTCTISSDTFSNVLVTDVDGQCVSSREMATAALRHLKRGGGFISLPHGKDFVNEYEDSSLFPLLYPSLYPYGSGGFESLQRKKVISMKRHAKLLCSLSDNRFREHYSFLFTAFNILQRRQVSLGAKLKTKQRNFGSLCTRLQSVSSETIESVLSSLRNGTTANDSSDDQRAVSGLLKEVSTITSYVPGSAASRTKMRNEIRAMMFDLGMPSFFITINPADVYHPLVKFLAGSEINIDDMLSEQIPKFKEQSQLVAKNPFVTAKFFDLYMKAFFKHIIGDSIDQGNRVGGMLGHATAYYGCVEAQGRGTLHCHLLVWLEGALNPQQIKDRIQAHDVDFANRLTAFIDDIIHNDVPDESRLADVHVPSDTAHPCTVRHVTSDSSVTNSAELQKQRSKDVRNLVVHCQSHVHRNTCWKYWTGPPAPKICRFNLDAANHVPKTFATESGELEYRVLNGLINNFCPAILEAVRCNMDIKFIGSGASAKAILYYVTDYITKSPLKTHVAYEALQAAIRKLESVPDVSQHSPDLHAHGKRLLVKCANSLISKQQLSGPQVAAYLCEYDDHFTSHQFRSLFWKTSESFIQSQDRSDSFTKHADLDVLVGVDANDRNPTDSCAELPDAESLSAHDEIVLGVDDLGNIEQHGNQCMDYRFRQEPFDALCLWDFVATIDKVRNAGSKDSADDDMVTDDSGNKLNFSDSEPRPERRKRETLPQCKLDPLHPESSSHFLRQRKTRHVPVPIGPSFPRRDREDLRETYCRVMLLLFKPWKNIGDLKTEDMLWSHAFERFVDSAPRHILDTIDNLQMLHECKDSRDDHYNQRRAAVHNSTSMSINAELIDSVGDSNAIVDSDLYDNEEVDVLQDLQDAARFQSNKCTAELAEVAACLSAADEGGLFAQDPTASTSIAQDLAAVTSDSTRGFEKLWLEEYSARREQAKRAMQKAADMPVSTETITQTLPEPISLQDCDMPLASDSDPHVISSDPNASDDFNSAELTAQSVADSFTLNEEQRLAFHMVAESSYLPRETPLRLYLGGPGGTGKSQVINALRRFFEIRNETRRFRVTSYTGVAAKNISGVTLHSALPALTRNKDRSPQAGADIRSMWSGVDFLFIDEISMVGCRFLSQISDALAKAKENQLPFGGINVIFAGDFAQLRPVGDKPLYADHRRTDRSVAASSTPAGQHEIAGRLLWTGVNECVMLRQQMRQSGTDNESFRRLLHRLRSGTCTDADFALLNSRILSNLPLAGETVQTSGAPIITASNAVKDALNRKAASHFAYSRGLESHLYFARDFRKGKPISDPLLRDWLLDLHSGKTDQRLGRLPLVIGMPVLVTTNYDVAGGVANGTEGILKEINYETDPTGCRYATSCVITVPTVPDGHQPLPHLASSDIVALAEKHDLHFNHPGSGKRITVHRMQLPVLPAFAMTDYKSQGRTLPRVILDIESCKTAQSPYVMLSRAVRFDDLFILRPFSRTKITFHQSEELRKENSRLKRICLTTTSIHATGSTREQAQAELTELNSTVDHRNSSPSSTHLFRRRHMSSNQQDAMLLNSIASLINMNESSSAQP